MRSSNPDEARLPPPPSIRPRGKPLELIKKEPTDRNRIPLLTNHFKVGVKSTADFYHYSVSMFYEDGTQIEGKGIGRKVLDKVKDTYKMELDNKEFAYDGEKTLFTVGQLPHKNFEFVVVLDDISSSRPRASGSSSYPEESEGDRKRIKHSFRSKTITVHLKYATKIPMQAIMNALRGQESDHIQDAVRVLDIILRQNAAKKGCLLVRQSFFHNEPRSIIELGGGVSGCRGFHSSFRATKDGLSLNMDVSTTMIVKPGPVLTFLLDNQNVKTPHQIDWSKAKRALKSLRITTYASKMEYKITGLSDKPCKQQTFFLKSKNGKGGDGEEITVSDYFKKHKHTLLRESADFPCINVGKPNRPSYFPLELCTLVPLQRYTKALSNLQRAALVEKSRQNPKDRKLALERALKHVNADKVLSSFGISISSEFMQVEGRLLPAPRLKVGNGEHLYPQKGKWNFNNKRFVEPVNLERWAVVNFSPRCDIQYLVNTMIKCGQMKGMIISNPYEVFEENPQNRGEAASIRVEKMIEYMRSRLPGTPHVQFLLCILPKRKNSDIYGPWKWKCLADPSEKHGVPTQCIAPVKLNDQYVTNVLLKINAKLDGMNSLLTVERSLSIPLVSKVSTLILGMDVSHGSPGKSDVPSIAAVVSSRHWPSISRYRAAVRTQSPKVETIASLFKPVSDEKDEGIINELLRDFYHSSNCRKPELIIIFRDGVSESQFSQILNEELHQIIEACKFLDKSTIIDNTVCHPKKNDFYLCAHAGMIGTTRPVHYHVLHDELGFSADELQDLVHSLSYVYQRSTTAVSLVAPICYAHLAAAQMSQFIKFDDMSETTSSHGGSVTVPGAAPVQELPKLIKDVAHSMFFC